MALDGINALIAVTQDKLTNANDNALNGAKKQSALVKQEQQVHAQQSRLQDMVRGKDLSQGQVDDIRRMLQADGIDASALNSLHGETIDGVVHYKTDSTHANADQGANNDIFEGIKAKFDARDQDLQAQDKLGNSEVQSLMSDYNQAETLASSVMKKRDEAGNAVIGKV